MILARRNRTMRALAALQSVWIAGCGSSSPSTPPSPPPTPNTVPVSVNNGPVPTYYVYNILYASVTICVPGSTSCQTVENVQVDTGSSGLRLLASAVTLALPQVDAANGDTVAECAQFSNSSTWGSVRTADVKLAGEVANSVSLQLIGDPALPTVPKACTNGGFPSEDDLTSLGSNGILGVGVYRQDCGVACELTGASNPGAYWQCPTASSCVVTTLQESQQVQNPVGLFASDNNGVVITLPAVSGPAAPTLTGTMYFGIGTQPDNSLGTATVYTLDRNGYIGTTFRGKSLPYSFIDSGSAAYFFPDSKIEVCSNYTLYCPDPSPVDLSAVITGANGVSSPAIAFRVDNADHIFKQYPGDSVLPTIGVPTLDVTRTMGPNGPNSFDWGLSFFYGRTVFSAIEGTTTPGGSGPYVAF
jgi:hypothetical protein